MRNNYLASILVLGAVLILTTSVSGRCETGSELLQVRRGVNKTSIVTFTRLVLDLKGERPINVESSSSDKIMISFRELRSKVEPNILIPDPAYAVTEIKILDAEKGSQILVQLRLADSVISHSFLPPESPNPGAYRLLVDVLPPLKQKVQDGDVKGAKSGAGTGEKPAEPAKTESSSGKLKGQDGDAKGAKSAAGTGKKPAEPSKIESSSGKVESKEPKYKEVDETGLSEPIKGAYRLLAEGNYIQAYKEYSRLLGESVLTKDESYIALYGLADSYYYMHQQGLSQVAEQVSTYYAEAIKAEPLATQAAWAYYRCGLAYQASGDHDKAVEAFQKAIQTYPKHPAIPLCWLGLGISYHKTASHTQAINALQTALELPLDQSQKAKAYWLLGLSLYVTGKYGPAIEAHEGCLAQDPNWYRNQPLLLKYLGESYFIQKQYDKSRDFLFWYLNLQPQTPGKDLLLATIAEVFLVQDEQDYANKLYDYIRTYYPDSQGDIIAQIRKADFLRSKGRISQEEDLGLFRGLAGRSLSPQLSKLVYLKLASREHEYGNFEESVILIDDILQGSSGAASYNDFLVLRSKVVLDWSKNAFQDHDYGRVIQLYESNQNTFAGAKTLELYQMIAESYMSINQYTKALATYQQIPVKKGQKVEEEILARMVECSLQAGDFDAAMKFCTQIQGTQFQHRKMMLLAQIYFAQCQYSKAIECLSSLPEKDIVAPSSPNLCRIYGESLFQLGDCEKALPWLQKASEQMEKTGSHSEELLHFYIAQSACYTKSKKHDKAIAVLESAMGVANTEDLRDQINYDISKHYLELGQSDKAVQRLTKLMNSTQSFWQTAAKQQLDYIHMNSK